MSCFSKLVGKLFGIFFSLNISPSNGRDVPTRSGWRVGKRMAADGVEYYGIPPETEMIKYAPIMSVDRK